MPTPTNSTELLKALVNIAEEIRKLHKSAENLLTTVNSAGIGESVANALSTSAIRSGMSQSQAVGYRDEYMTMINRIRHNVTGTVDLLETSGNWAEAVLHIATVVPHRCRGARNGVLPLTGR